ncbi:Nucleoid-associated protein (plasmid) [Vibrio scophthalmi]|uniref:Nucleoid-associated protein n=1 Tax=Vibrio scophthalmi TaxID=45658 RepID=A0A1C7FHS3_9VIBR|nr:Nucleoid-associated protein [Vibrio scophthalmi]
MPITLSHLSLHQLVKQDDGELHLQLRPTPLDNDPHSEGLTEQLHQHFVNKPGKGYGFF